MKVYRFELGLAVILLAIVAMLWLWQNSGMLQGPLTAEEIERYSQRLETLPFPEAERPTLMKALADWMAADDGRSFHMLNLMRFYPELRRFEGAPDYNGTPQQSNAHYEELVMPMLFKVGGTPLFAGNVNSGNLIEYAPELNNWSRVLLVRYPSRRAFLDLVTNPAYGPIEPYKLMALKVVLVPVQTEMIVPSLPWLAAGILLPLFLGIGWWRNARRV